MIGALRLAARMSCTSAALCGALVAVAATLLHLLLLADAAPDPLVLALLASGAAGFGASVGAKLPDLCFRKLLRHELSGPLGPAWSRLTQDLLEIEGRGDLLEDPKRQRLIEAYADAFANFPIYPRRARKRMLRAIALSEELLERDRRRASRRTTTEGDADGESSKEENL